MPRKTATPKKATAAAALETHTQVVAVVTRQYFEGKNPLADAETKNELLEVRRFLTEPAKVSVSKGLTLNLGNYESARVEVSVVIPCYREELDAAYSFADKWVETRLGAEVSSVRANKPSLF